MEYVKLGNSDLRVSRMLSGRAIRAPQPFRRNGRQQARDERRTCLGGSKQKQIIIEVYKVRQSTRMSAKNK